MGVPKQWFKVYGAFEVLSYACVSIIDNQF